MKVKKFILTVVLVLLGISLIVFGVMVFSGFAMTKDFELNQNQQKAIFHIEQLEDLYPDLDLKLIDRELSAKRLMNRSVEVEYHVNKLRDSYPIVSQFLSIERRPSDGLMVYAGLAATMKLSDRNDRKAGLKIVRKDEWLKYGYSGQVRLYYDENGSAFGFAILARNGTKVMDLLVLGVAVETFEEFDALSKECLQGFTKAKF